MNVAFNAVIPDSLLSGVIVLVVIGMVFGIWMARRIDPAELLAAPTLLVSTAPQSTAKSAMPHSDSSGRHWVLKSWWGEALTCHCLW
jgi:hypothetical protein